MDIKIFHDDPTALFQQVVNHIRKQIIIGNLKPGQRLPTARKLSAQLNLNLNTVARAYHDLIREGVLYSRGSRGTYVANDVNTPTDQHRRLSIMSKDIWKLAKDTWDWNASPDEVIRMFRACYETLRSKGRRDD